ncbi:MAG: ABC transporter ATP-binding protein [Nitrospirae bacterium]|nr:MAG: ABC transporter ATP-binding protein [Nitrospirota bacterium]
MFNRMLQMVRPYWSRMLLAIVLSLLISGMNGALAWLVKPALDGIFLEKNAALLTFLPFGVLIVFLLRGVFSFCQAYLMRSTGAKVMRDIWNRLYQHLLFLPVNEFKKESSSAILSRVINDAAQLQTFLAGAVKDIFVESATLVVLLGVAFYRKWELALLAITVFPAAFYGVQRIGKRLKKVSIEANKKISLITEFLSETFSGIKMVKVFRREKALIDTFSEKNQDFYRNLMRSTRLMEFTSLLMEFVGGIGIAFVLWYGGRLVIAETISPGDFFSFLTAIFMVYTPAKRLASAHNGVQKSKASLERLDELFAKTREADGQQDMPVIRRSIEFRSVVFRYPLSKHNVLDNINIEVKKGEIIAIVGRSGAGKTSLADLIPRFYDPVSGGIFVDGVDVRDVKLGSLRDQIGLVSQDIILFNDTVRANILFGNPAASEEELVAAAKAAYAHEFILELPNGYDTVIGERGVMVSGGQRQRLSIARAILKNPPILILDEATSALDTESELKVQMALDTLMQNRTTFVIAHRLSTVKKAGRIMVLEKGRIVETGPHEELMQHGGTYKKLHDLQLSAGESGDS